MGKKSIGIILAVVLIICGGTAFALTYGNSNKKPVQKPEATESQTVTTVTEAGTVTEDASSASEAETSQTVSESAAAPSTVDYGFLKNSVWYFFDEANREAYAFSFEDEDDVNVTYFSTDNIDGGDVKTSSGEADYSVADGKLIIDDMPKNIDKDGFLFFIKDGKITDESGNELEKTKEVSLNYAYSHFNS